MKSKKTVTAWVFIVLDESGDYPQRIERETRKSAAEARRYLSRQWPCGPIVRIELPLPVAKKAKR